MLLIPKSRDGSALSPSGNWIATEKVHGAQRTIATDGRQVKIGKRKSWLGDREGFFGWQLLRIALENAALSIHRQVASNTIVRLFGEMFGGHYPHPNVLATPGAAPVQTGIWYAPDIRFVLFDVLVEHIDGPIFLSHGEVESLAARSHLHCVPVLGRGPRRHLEQLPVRFVTRIPAMLGLPALDDNTAEGFVLKPNAICAAASRYVIKHKIPEFNDARFDESMPWNPDVLLGLVELQDVARRLVNLARLASARSKVGTESTALREEIVLDVLVDLELTFPSALRSLSATQDEYFRSYIGGLAADLVS